MAGLAGSLIGIVGRQPTIASAQGLIDSGTTGRGCVLNFIGFGFGLTSVELLPADFSAADDTVVRQIAAGATIQTPTYSAIAGVTDAKTLSWVTGGVASPPVNTVTANITGTAQVGQVLTAAGTWTGAPTPSLTYQWYVDGIPAAGGTAVTYTVVVGDIGKTATVEVVGSNPFGTVTVLTAPTAVIIA